jgi:membrane-associated protein
MESWLEYMCVHAHIAPFIFFGLLILAGLNIPISEDIILITAGFLASQCMSEHTLFMYFWVFAGSLISAWEVYWIGRLLGPKLYDIKFFNRVVTPTRIDKLGQCYERFGVFTFIFGRFIPGGFRNALFMSSGLSKMPFWKFILRDGIGCLIATSVIFSIGYQFAEHYDLIISTFKKYSLIAGIIFVLALVTTVIFLLKSNKSNSDV